MIVGKTDGQDESKTNDKRNVFDMRAFLFLWQVEPCDLHSVSSLARASTCFWISFKRKGTCK